MNLSFILAVGLNAYGFINNDPLIISISQIFVCTGFLINHYYRYRISNLNPITFYNLGMLITSFAHTFAFYNIDKKSTLTYNYFHYSAPEFYVLAMEIFFIGVVGVSAGFNYGLKFRAWAPKIIFTLPNNLNYFIFGIGVVILIFATNYISLPGAIQKIIDLIPVFYIFIVVRKSYIEDKKELRIYGLIVMGLLCFHNLLYSYLRSTIILPIVVYLFGILTTKKRIVSFLTIDTILLILLTLFLNSYFSLFGENRGSISVGIERINQINKLNQIKKTEPKDADAGNQQNIFARASLINQLSQIGRVVKEEGFYQGSTLAYLSYALIPRFLWPEKPIIQQGAWFAQRIGQAIQNEHGKYNNSVNMTVYGEFYLNFGYLGVILGGFLFGIIFCQFWLVCDFYGNHNNILGTGLGLTLIIAGFFQLGADLQFLVTQIALYLLLLAITLVFKKTNG